MTFPVSQTSQQERWRLGGPPERAADDLLACGQARFLKAEDYSAFAACLPKDVLISGAKAAGRTDVRVSWPKAKLADYFLAQVSFEVAAEHFGAPKFIALDDIRPLERPLRSGGHKV